MGGQAPTFIISSKPNYLQNPYPKCREIRGWDFNI